MKTVPRAKIGPLWDKYWREMKQEWFKLEVLQDYAVEDEGPSLKSWLKGDKQVSIKLMADDDDLDYTKDCLIKRAEGVNLLRIHIVEEPLTPYMQWEIEFYRQVSIPLRKENVYLVDKAEIAELDIPNGDLMIFDMKRAVLNKYDQHGLMIAENFYDEGDDISKFLELRRQLITLANPLKI